MAWRIVRKISVCAIALVAVFGVLDNFSLLVFDADATTSDLDASATIGASATIALNTNNVAFSILPSSEGTFGKSNALVVSTYTNNDYNCDVTMIADSANLTNGSYTIPSLESGTTYTESTFTNNSWGYQIESGNYKPVIATEAANPIKTITTMTGSTPDTTNIYFAAKFTTAVKAGDYTNTVTFASTCTPPPVSTYMQDQTTSTLATLLPNVGDTVTLTDKRDNTQYVVGKLADNNYWMLDNLAIDLTTVPLNTLKGNTNATDTSLEYLKGVQTRDPNNDPNGNYATAGVSTNWSENSYSAPIIVLSGTCQDTSYCVNDPTTGQWNKDSMPSGAPVGSKGHNKIGIYYNYCAASAGSYCYGNGSSEGNPSGNAASDICPSGWRMPSSEGYWGGEFAELVLAYNLVWDGESEGYLDDGSSAGLKYNLSTVGSGIYYDGLAYLQGDNGYFWSSSLEVPGFMYSFSVGVAHVFTNDTTWGEYGNSVRCIFNIPAPTYDVTVSLDSGVSSVTFAGDNTTQTATSASSTVSLKQGVSYTITANLASGYDFSGWSTTSGITVSSTTTNPTTITATGTGTLSVSSVLDCAVTTFSGYMQDMTTTTVTNACVGTSGTLTDRRDSKTYTVKKLADGKLWMTENLAIDLTATSYDTLYGTGTNAGKMTNATSQALGYLKGTTTGTSSDQWAMAAVEKTWTSSYSYSQPWIAVDSSTSGKCSDAYCVNSDKSWSSASVTSKTINGTTSIAQGKIGVYYNYCAASAGSYCWGNGTSTSGSPSSDPNTSSLRDITSDICPYGWRLPTSSDSGEFQALYTAYSSNYTNFQTALSTPLSGFFYNGKAYSQGYGGSFWSSTWCNSTIMYRLYVDSTSVSPSSIGYRYDGFSVRCVFGS